MKNGLQNLRVMDPANKPRISWDKDIQWALESGPIKACLGKIKHTGPIQATKAAYSIESQRSGERFDVYPCPFCYFWHIGHSSRDFPCHFEGGF